MSLIYILLPDGQQTPYEEREIYELLAQDALPSEGYFWKDGMDEWRPMDELPPRDLPTPEPTPADERTVAPPRRAAKRAANLKTPVKSMPIIERRATPPSSLPEPVVKSGAPDDDSRQWKRKSAGRFYFRVNPVPLTVCLQILMVLAIGAAVFLVYQCVEKIYGGNDTEALANMSGLLGEKVTAANPSGVSLTDLSFSNYFLCALSGLQLLVELLFYLWVYYANKNSRGFSNNILFTSAWAVAYFVIPFVNLFRPYQVMQEIWKVSEEPRSWLGRRDSIYVGVWFLLRVSILVISNRWLYNTSELGYLAVIETDIVLIEASTLILITLVIWRQIKWVRKKQ